MKNLIHRLPQKLLSLCFGLLLSITMSFGITQPTFYVNASVGASGDGSTPALAFKTIQEAVTAMQNPANIILIGDFTISTPITISGKSLTFIPETTATARPKITCSGSFNCFTVSGTSMDMFTINGIEIAGGSNAISSSVTVSIYDCYFHDFTNSAISLNATMSTNYIQKSIFSNINQAIVINGGNSTYVDHNTFVGTNSIGSFALYTVNAMTFITNNIINNFNKPILKNGEPPVIEYNCIFPNGDSCAALANSYNIAVDPLLDSNFKLTASSPIACKEGGVDNSNMGAFPYVVPTCDLQIVKTALPAPDAYKYTAQTTGYTNITAYNWTIYKNGSPVYTSDVNPMTFPFTQSGDYEIALTITADAGCGTYTAALGQLVNICTVAIAPGPPSGTDSVYNAVIDGFTEPTYAWYLNKTLVGTTNSRYGYQSKAGDVIEVRVASAACSTKVAYYTVKSTQLPCSVKLDGTQINGPQYEFKAIWNNFTPGNYIWKIDGNQVSGNNSNILTYAFTTADWHNVSVTNANCTTSVDQSDVWVETLCLTHNLRVSKDDNPQMPRNYFFIVDNGNKNSIYNWRVSNGDDLDSMYTTTSFSSKFNFSSDGAYSVTAEIIDTVTECYDRLDTRILVGSQNCYAYFYQIQDELDSLKFTFYNGSYENKKYAWDFGDGSKIDTAFNPAFHKYAKAGVYTITLTIADPKANCSDKYSRAFVAGEVSCRADFNYKIDGLKVTFNNLSTGNQSNQWAFGDWNWDFDSVAVHTYEDPGIYDVYLTISNDKGGWDEIVKTIKVGDLKDYVSADFSSFGGDNNLQYFTDASSSNVKKWYWTFGDGSFSNDTNPKNQYNKAGIYNVCLTVTGESGQMKTNCYDIWVGNVECTAQAAFSFKVDTAKKTISLINKSKGNIDSYYWDFGDGQTSNDSAPKPHVYDKPGMYYVTLTTQEWGTWCSSYADAYVQVGELECLASFDYSVDAVKKTVTIKNKSKGDIGEYYWWFDDDDFATKAEPVKTFDNPGMHYVGLTIVSKDGNCWDYAEKEIQVGEVDCSAKFSYYVDKTTNTAVCQNKSIGKTTQYYWVFGDGKISTEANPSHKFKFPGYYAISLNTFDPNTWCMDYFETVVLVGEEGKDCVADFIYKVDTTKALVKFSDNSKGNPIKYTWDFGDGTISDKTSPEHTYSKGGYYDVCLSIENSSQIPNITCKSIKIAASEKTNCQAKFDYTVSTDKKTATFFDKSLGSPTKYKWDFGDSKGVVGTKKDTSYKYANSDYYLVNLNIETKAGCKSSAWKLVNVGMKDTFLVAFGFEAQAYDKKAGGYPVDFIGAGLGDQARLKWSFGDDSKDSVNTTTNSPSHLYDTIGTYNVCLTYADPVTGDVSKHCEAVSTEKLCTADQEPPVAICKNITVKLDATGNATIKDADIDGGSKDACTKVTVVAATKAFTKANIGTNKVKLTVTDENKLSSTCEATVTVEAASTTNLTDVMVSNLEVYPNPFNNQVTVSYNLLENSTVELALYDMVGKRITDLSSNRLQSGNQSIQFDLSAIKSGSYILQLRTGNGVVKKEMIMKR
jgi:PKD repeat protein